MYIYEYIYTHIYIHIYVYKCMYLYTPIKIRLKQLQFMAFTINKNLNKQQYINTFK